LAKRGKRWRQGREQIDPEVRYSAREGIDLLLSTPAAGFDESVDVAFRLGIDPRHADQMVRGAVALPNGSGKDVRICVFAQGDAAKAAEEAGADVVGSDELVQKVNDGWLEFDKVVATRDMMGKVGRLGRVLGPRGLMPNPKVGTVCAPDQVASTVKALKGGRIDFRVEKAGIVHVPIGRRSMGAEALTENLMAFALELRRLRPAAAKGTYVKSVAVSSTMSACVRLDTNELMRDAQA
jgi:large subunit ribosomal protein L1